MQAALQSAERTCEHAICSSQVDVHIVLAGPQEHGHCGHGIIVPATQTKLRASSVRDVAKIDRLRMLMLCGNRYPAIARSDSLCCGQPKGYADEQPGKAKGALGEVRLVPDLLVHRDADVAPVLGEDG